MKKLLFFIFALACTLCSFADDYEMSGTYRSKLIPDAVENSYKNTLSIKVNAIPSAQNKIVVTRKAGNSKTASNVATITLNADGAYTISYSTPVSVNSEDRFDSEAYVTSGNVTAGGEIAVVDYFTASTYADHIKNEAGGDKAGSYTYTAAIGSTTVATYVVPVYGASAFYELESGYSLSEILADTDHSLAPKGVTIYCSDPENATVSSWKIYKEGEVVANTQSFVENELTETKQVYIGEMTIMSPDGYMNTYGTDSRAVYPTIVTADVASTAMSTYTFTSSTGVRNCHYFTSLMTLHFEYMPQEGDFTTRPIPRITDGGYRVWRTCTTAAEENSAVLDRANDFLFFDNVGTETGVDKDGTANQRSNIGGDFVTVGETTCYSGLFGSSSKTPTVNYTIRVYYWLETIDPDPLGAPKRSVSRIADGTPRYYVSELVFPFTFPENIVTGVEDMGAKQVDSVQYSNLAGVTSTTPFSGVNIVVTRYTDGTTSVTKVIR